MNPTNFEMKNKEQFQIPCINIKVDYSNIVQIMYFSDKSEEAVKGIFYVWNAVLGVFVTSSSYYRKQAELEQNMSSKMQNVETDLGIPNF